MKNEVKLLEDIVEENMAEYSSYVLLSRAIPDIRDGLKPSYRRILWAMEKMGATSFTKSAQISGEIMKIHPHGDTYPTLVGMTQTDAHFNPYIEGKGNFGLHASDLLPASSRYSEARLSKVARDMIGSVSKQGIEMVKTFDGKGSIPEVFPVNYPSILAYSQSGIGVGFSSNIPSFNPAELCQAVVNYIKKGEQETLIPDFPTGGYLIQEDKPLSDINRTGKGSIKLRAKTEVEGDQIVISEVPYTTTIDKIEDKILALHKEGKLKELKRLHNSTDIEGIGLKVVAKRGVDMDVFLEKLYQMTPMESTFSSNIMVLGLAGLPKQMGVWEVITEWLDWRVSVIAKELQHETTKKEKELEILQGLMKVKDGLDEVITVIREATEEEVEHRLHTKFDLSTRQAKYVADLKLRNITVSYITKRSKDVQELEQVIKENKRILGSDQLILGRVVEDLEHVAKVYGKPRHTEVIPLKSLEKKVKNFNKVASEGEEYNVRVYVTEENYIKKIPLTSLRGNFEIKTKVGDTITDEVETTNSDEVLVFTDHSNVHKVYLADITDNRPSDMGQFTPNLVELEQGEEINKIIPLNQEVKYILFGFDNGKVAKVDVNAYRTKTKRKRLKNAFNASSPVKFITPLTDDVDLLAQSSDTRTVILNTESIAPKSSRATAGSNFIRLKEGEHIQRFSTDLDGMGDLDYYTIKSAGVGKLWQEKK